MSFNRIWIALVAIAASVAITSPADALQTRAYSAGAVKSAIASFSIGSKVSSQTPNFPF
jgi:hypothetical protein